MSKMNFGEREDTLMDMLHDLIDWLPENGECPVNPSETKAKFRNFEVSLLQYMIEVAIPNRDKVRSVEKFVNEYFDIRK